MGARARVADVDALERRVVADVVRSVAVGDLPDVVARVEVDRGDRAVGGLGDGQASRAADAARAHADPLDVGVGVDIDAGDQPGRAAAAGRRDVEDTRRRVDRRAARNVGSAVGARAVDRGAAGTVLTRGRVEERTHAEVADDLERLGAEFGGEIDQVFLADALHLVGRGAGDVGLRGRQLLAGHVGLRHGALLDRPHGLPGLAVQDVRPALLGGLHDRLDGAPVHVDVDQVGRGRVVVVPDVVMHGLEVPAALAGLDVEGEDAGRE